MESGDRLKKKPRSLEEENEDLRRQLSVQKKITDAAIRTAAHWDDVSDHLLWGEERAESGPISERHMISTVALYPQYAKEIENFVKRWNSDPRLPDEVLSATDHKQEPDEKPYSDRSTARILNFYSRLRDVERRLSESDDKLFAATASDWTRHAAVGTSIFVEKCSGALAALPIENPVSVARADEMLGDIIRGKVSGTEAHRWLGWAQAVVCASGGASLEELKEVNEIASDRTLSAKEGKK